MARKPMTLARMLRRRLWLPAMLLLAVLPGYVLAQVVGETVTFVDTPGYHAQPTPEQRAQERHEEQRAARVRRLIAVHACWTHDGPVGVIPGHAVVTINGHVRYVGGELASQALDRALSGENPPHALCR